MPLVHDIFSDLVDVTRNYQALKKSLGERDEELREAQSQVPCRERIAFIASLAMLLFFGTSFLLCFDFIAAFSISSQMVRTQSVAVCV